MTTEEINEKIRLEIEKTREKIDSYKEITQPIAPDCAIGRVSRMDAIINKSVAESALRKAEQKLKNLEYVTTKIGQEDFGKCVLCNQQIPIERIIIRPESIHCVDCAKKESL